MRRRKLPVLLLVLSLTLSTINASSGDRNPPFQFCLSACEANCPNADPLALHLRLTLWTCSDNCKYECMRSITAKHVSENQPIHQYFGKWPFKRIWGLQEPASVVFSLFNLYTHIYGFQRVNSNVPRGAINRPWIIVNCVLGALTWVSSTLFHARDSKYTELMDYFTAMAYVTYGASFSLYKLMKLDVKNGGQLKQSLKLVLRVSLWMLSLGFYFRHIRYLVSSERFDYSYNMIAGVVLGIIWLTGWLIWGVLHWGGIPSRRPIWELWFGHGIDIPMHSVRKVGRGRYYAWKIVIVVIATAMAMSLELLDFPPIYDTFDAHSFWHAATIPITFVYYDFFVDDAIWEHRRIKGKFSAAR
ncbi:hypothetical protein HK098_006804 [Nowakowskiella sp. JEL0407]|nr:hypothetical protein HK098_006804 [Nowakowskiella sp. JEL0407]